MALLSLVPKSIPPDSPAPRQADDENRSHFEGLSQQTDTSPGILVLAPPLRLLHMNQRAMGLMNSHLNGEEPGVSSPKVATGVLPAPILQLCKDIFHLLQDRGSAKDWERFEVRRVIGLPQQQLVLRGFGVPDPRGGKHSRLVVLMDPVTRPKEGIAPQATARFRFTPREQGVIACLSKGWTNKEIAKSLGISLPTVKEHVRHIMEKTHSTTRTGALVQILNPDDDSARPTPPPLTKEG